MSDARRVDSSARVSYDPWIAVANTHNNSKVTVWKLQRFVRPYIVPEEAARGERGIYLASPEIELARSEKVLAWYSYISPIGSA